MKYFVKDFFAALPAGVVIYGMRVDDDLSYEFESQPFPAYSSLYHNPQIPNL